MNEVILVDEHDRPVGVAEKLKAHSGGGRLHRAFSVFVFDDAGRLLLQRRAAGKYHFGGRWSNTCCGHPRPGEDSSEAARRRLSEEFGFDCDLSRVGSFTYHAHDSASGLAEHEIDHVFVGKFNGAPAPNAAEIDQWRWIDPADLKLEMRESPDRFTPWLKPALGVALSEPRGTRRPQEA